MTALVKRFGPDRLMRLAAEKDAGFSIPTFLEALFAMRRLTPKDWARDEVAPETAAATQRLFEGWRRWLEHPETERRPGGSAQSPQPRRDPSTAG